MRWPAKARRARGRNGPTATEVRLTRIRCELPSGVCVVAGGESLGLDEFIDSLADALKRGQEGARPGVGCQNLVVGHA